MTTKRVLFKSIEKNELTKALFELEQLVETSKEVELFNSEIYFVKIDSKNMVGLSIIGIDGELFESLKLVDMNIVKLGNEQRSFIDNFPSNFDHNEDEVIVIDSRLEIFKVVQVQKLVD